jgi:hypothetical protein
MSEKVTNWDNVIASMNVNEFLTTVANGGQLKYTTNEKGNPIFAMHYGDNKGVAFKLFGKNVAVGSMSKSVYEELVVEENPNWDNYQFDIVNSEEAPALKLRKVGGLDLAAWSDLF